MSMPNFPETPDLKLEDSIIQIISSIAMEAHVKLKLKKFIENSQIKCSPHKIGLHLLFLLFALCL